MKVKMCDGSGYRAKNLNVYHGRSTFKRRCGSVLVVVKQVILNGFYISNTQTTTYTYIRTYFYINSTAPTLIDIRMKLACSVYLAYQLCFSYAYA